MYCMVVMCKCIVNGCTKIYFIIDQQIARNSVHYNECLYHPFPSMQLKFIYYLKDLSQLRYMVDILANRGIIILLNVPLV